MCIVKTINAIFDFYSIVFCLFLSLTQNPSHTLPHTLKFSLTLTFSLPPSLSHILSLTLSQVLVSFRMYCFHKLVPVMLSGNSAAAFEWL